MTNSNPRVGISGMGFMTPAGASADAVHASLVAGEGRFEDASVYGPEHGKQRAGVVADSAIAGVVPKRSRRKLDRGTVFAVAALDGAVAEAGLVLDADEGDRIGLVVGNCTGGWGYVEKSMYGLYGAGGMSEVNAYVATAWFPAAAQGEYSISKGLRGISKTLSSGRLSGGAAIEWAARWIAAGRCDAVLAGGTEAPVNALVHNAFACDGVLSQSQRFRPFSEDADGALLAEGSVMCCVESEASARDRGQDLLALLSGTGSGRTLEAAIANCLRQAQLRPQDVDHIILDADGRPSWDRDEYAALGSAFAGVEGVTMSAPKSAYGHLLGAGMAADVATAVLSLRHQCLYPTVAGESLAAPPVGRHIVEAEQASLQRVLVLGRDMDGRALAMLVAQA